MIKSGIDVNVFKPHSTRAASTRKANLCQVPVDAIRQAASGKGDCTFRKFYCKPIVENVSQFGQAILGTSSGGVKRSSSLFVFTVNKLLHLMSFQVLF